MEEFTEKYHSFYLNRFPIKICFQFPCSYTAITHRWAIGSGHGLSCNGQHAVTWANTDQSVWCHWAFLGQHESNGTMPIGKDCETPCCERLILGMVKRIMLTLSVGGIRPGPHATKGKSDDILQISWHQSHDTGFPSQRANLMNFCVKCHDINLMTLGRWHSTKSYLLVEIKENNHSIYFPVNTS